MAEWRIVLGNKFNPPPTRGSGASTNPYTVHDDRCSRSDSVDVFTDWVRGAPRSGPCCLARARPSVYELRTAIASISTSRSGSARAETPISVMAFVVSIPSVIAARLTPSPYAGNFSGLRSTT
jgi:hypothetical protein